MISKDKILITGTAGFIGFHLAKKLLDKNFQVVGIDGLTDYYDINLKRARHKILSKYENFLKVEFLLEDSKKLKRIFKEYKPSTVIHLAGQAGVRFSMEDPKSYVDSNIIGSFNILEMCKNFQIKHLLFSSTSSVYGDSTLIPSEKFTKQMNLYLFMLQQKNHVKL